MSGSIVRLWLFLFVPFVILVLTFLSGVVVPHQDLWGHATFHLIYLPVLAVSCWALWRFIGAAPTRTQRVIAGLMLFLQSVAIFGHAGELVTVIQNGFFNAPESIFMENPTHVLRKLRDLGHHAEPGPADRADHHGPHPAPVGPHGQAARILISSGML